MENLFKEVRYLNIGTEISAELKAPARAYYPRTIGFTKYVRTRYCQLRGDYKSKNPIRNSDINIYNLCKARSECAAKIQKEQCVIFQRRRNNAYVLSIKALRTNLARLNHIVFCMSVLFFETSIVKWTITTSIR